MGCHTTCSNLHRIASRELSAIATVCRLQSLRAYLCDSEGSATQRRTSLVAFKQVLRQRRQAINQGDHAIQTSYHRTS